MSLVREMQRGWAESVAIIEQFAAQDTGRLRWTALPNRSPTLTEREADAAILGRGVAGQYRMISLWHERPKKSALVPVRIVESLDRVGNDPKAAQVTGWRPIDWRPSSAAPTWKAGRSDDLAEAIEYVRRQPDGLELRVITVRRMLRAEMRAGRLTVIKKHYIALHPLDLDAVALFPEP